MNENETTADRQLVDAIKAKLRYFVCDHVGVFPPPSAARPWIQAMEELASEIRQESKGKLK